MATQAAAEKALKMIAFIPPVSDTVEYGLLRALDVHGGKKGSAEFSPMRSGIDEDFLKSHEMQRHISALKNFHENAVKTQSSPEDINIIIDKFSAINGSLGLSIKNLFKSKTKAGASTDLACHLNISNMKKNSIPAIKPVEDFLGECVLPFAKWSSNIRHIFRRTPTIVSGDLEYGVAFVTTVVKGETNAMEGKVFHAEAELKVADAAIDTSRERLSIGRGVVGITVHFFLLAKTRHNPQVQIKESFPVGNSRDKNLQYVLGCMATKIRRKIMGPKPATVQGMIMAEDYDSSGNYQQDIESLTRIAEHQASEFAIMDTEEQQTHTASLRVLGMSDAPGQDAPAAGEETNPFLRSHNLLYRSSMEDLTAICKAIHDKGSVIINGKVINGIKPVIKASFMKSLPIVYDCDISGIPHDGQAVPDWVLRAERGGNLIMLWKVSGVEEGSGIVTAYENDWHVRESREYIDSKDRVQIDKLESEGFFQLDPEEADPEEVDMAQLKGGRLVMMCRHLLALKQFRIDEAELSTTSAPESSAAASLSAEKSEAATASSTASFEPGIPPVVTDVRSETPLRKKFKK